MATETRNIVILGASYGGLSISHYLCKHVLPSLLQSKEAKYQLHIVNETTHFWWHISAPRAIVSVSEMKHSDTFVPIADGFKQYSNLKDSIVFHYATATHLDADARKVTLSKTDGGEEILEYYALVIATGIKSPTPLTTFHGDYTNSQRALDEANEKLKSAKEIVIGGGGPVGVETAGELGTHLTGKKITLITSSKKLLPNLRQSLSDKAEKQLAKVGVKVQYGVRVEGSDPNSDGRTAVKLSNGETILADMYIPAVGVEPNTNFLPDSLKRSNGYVKTNEHTLRVDEAGPRVYAAGDIANVDNGGVLNLFSTIPVLGANMAHDLLGRGAEKQYHFKRAETQLVPIGMKSGVGAFNGWSMPGFAISMVKGKDYFLKTMSDITQGKKWTKA